MWKWGHIEVLNIIFDLKPAPGPPLTVALLIVVFIAGSLSCFNPSPKQAETVTTWLK